MCGILSDSTIDGRELAQNDALLKTWTRNTCAQNGSQIKQRYLIKTINFFVENSLFGTEHLFNIGKMGIIYSKQQFGMFLYAYTQKTLPVSDCSNA